MDPETRQQKLRPTNESKTSRNGKIEKCKTNVPKGARKAAKFQPKLTLKNIFSMTTTLIEMVMA